MTNVTYKDQQETIDVLLSALKEITRIKDPKSGDRGGIKFARHIALCAIAAVDEAANPEIEL